MATCREVIKRAMRRLNLLAAGREPKASEATDGLTALQGLYQTLVSSGSLGELTAIAIQADYDALEWQRITSTDGVAHTITLPVTITDASTDLGYRMPYDKAVVLVAGATPATYIYEAVLGDWVLVEGLTLDSVAPLSTQLAEGLAARLALSIADEYGRDLPPAVARASITFMATLTGRHAEQRQPLAATYF